MQMNLFSVLQKTNSTQLDVDDAVHRTNVDLLEIGLQQLSSPGIGELQKNIFPFPKGRCSSQICICDLAQLQGCVCVSNPWSQICLNRFTNVYDKIHKHKLRFTNVYNCLWIILSTYKCMLQSTHVHSKLKTCRYIFKNTSKIK